MLLPEIVHLPAVMLLVLVVITGVALPVAVPFAASIAQSSVGQWAAAFGVLLGTGIATWTAWFGFRASRRALPTGRFLGFTSRIWSIAIPLAYFTGIAFGIYLCVLFYV
jgi:hypothetical protein